MADAIVAKWGFLGMNSSIASWYGPTRDVRTSCVLQTAIGMHCFGMGSAQQLRHQIRWGDAFVVFTPSRTVFMWLLVYRHRRSRRLPCLVYVVAHHSVLWHLDSVSLP